MSNFLPKSRRTDAGLTTLSNIVGGLQRAMNNNGSTFVEKRLAGSVISMESLQGQDAELLGSAVADLQQALESVCDQVGPNGKKLKLTRAQEDAAICAGVLASDIGAYLRSPVQRSNVSLESGAEWIPVAPAVQWSGGAMENRGQGGLSLESYDESENRAVSSYAIAYNMAAARQDPFSEMFFPTITIPPDQIGFSISIRQVLLMNEVRRNVSGAIDNFNRRNIIEAVINPDLLRNDQTNIVPVYNDDSKDKFLSPDLFTPTEILVGDEPVLTAPLKLGTKLSLLGISQTKALLDTGILDQTDAIDPGRILLKAIYLRLKGAAADGSEDELVKFNTDRIPLSNFLAAPQGDSRLMNLNFINDDLKIDANTKLVDGSDSALLAPLQVGKQVIRLSTSISGSLNLQFSETNVYGGAIDVSTVATKEGVNLALTDATAAALIQIFKDASIVGYDLDARRTNSNRRQRGQLMDMTWKSQTFGVPLLAPISVVRPHNAGDQNDASDLAALITTTRIRASNDGVTELFRVAETLKEYTHNNDSTDKALSVLGVGRYLSLKPQYVEETINVKERLDSLTTTQRKADVQALLVNIVRDIAYRMWRDSGYKAAADAVSGGTDTSVPKLLIGTDQIIERYLMTDGDLRLMGPGMDYQVESTQNMHMANKIVFSFGIQNAGSDGVPNPLHFGNMAWKPEVPIVLPTVRNGANSKELTVMPSYVHINHLPMLCVLHIEGLDDALTDKVTINVSQ